jgi:hypothetical protein
MWQQHGAGWSQPHPSGVSLEQLKAELALQRLDPLRERGLRQVEVLRGMSEMAGIGYFHKSPELPQFHRARLWADAWGRLKILLIALESLVACSQLDEQLASLEQIAHALDNLVYARHLQVEKNDIGRELFERSLDLSRVGDGAKRGRRAAQELFQLTNGRRLVIDDEHARMELAHGRGAVSTAQDKLDRSPQKVMYRYEYIEQTPGRLRLTGWAPERT